MSKYYTPEIEEFHVGFECEVVQEAKWVKVEVIYSNMGYFERRLNEGESARVKYLDREDIESFGFKSLNKERPYGSSYFKKRDEIYINHDKITEIRLTHRITEIQISHDGGMDSEFKLVFNGKIKNKSELGRVLKMVGVI